MDTFEALKLFLEGKKVARDLWSPGSFVELKDDGAYNYITDYKNDKDDVNVRTMSLHTPATSLEVSGFNPDKKWILVESSEKPYKLHKKISTHRYTAP